MKANRFVTMVYCQKTRPSAKAGESCGLAIVIVQHASELLLAANAANGRQALRWLEWIDQLVRNALVTHPHRGMICPGSQLLKGMKKLLNSSEILLPPRQHHSQLRPCFNPASGFGRIQSDIGGLPQIRDGWQSRSFDRPPPDTLEVGAYLTRVRQFVR